MANKNNFKSIRGGKPPMPAGQRKKPMLPPLKNDALEAQIDAYRESKSMDQLLETFEQLRQAKVLFPAQLGENNAVSFATIQDNEGHRLAVVYTSAKQLPKNTVMGNLLLLPYPAVNNLIANYMKNNSLDGVAVNPNGSHIRLTPAAVTAIEEAEQKSRESGKHEAMELKAPQAPQQPKLPPLKNKEVDPLIDAFGETQDQKERTNILNRMLDQLYQANVVLKVQQAPDGRDGNQVFVDDGIRRLAVYTSPAALMKHPLNKAENPSSVKVGIVPFEKACAFAMDSRDGLSGIKLIAESGKALNMENRLLEQVKKVNEQREKAKQNAVPANPADMSPEAIEKMAKELETKEMSEEERASLEHRKFELAFLPMTLFEKGQEFIDDLCSRKENCVDELFEESYYDIRMYPYLEEEFAVLAIQTEDNLEAIRIDFPEAGQTAGCASRAYIIWDNNAGMGKYYALVRGGKDQHAIMEMTREGKPVLHGPAPTEGTELQAIIDLFRK